MKVQNMNRNDKNTVQKYWRKMILIFKVTLGPTKRKDKLHKERR